MRHGSTLRKALILSTAVVFSVSGLWASSAFGKTDLEQASLADIKKSYEEAVEDYNDEYDSIKKTLDKAFAQRNSKKFYQAKDEMDSLERPVITQEDDEKLVTRMMDASDDEKDQWAEFLFENDPYYSPSLTMTMDSSDDHSRYSYQQTLRVKPGEDVKLPTLSYSGEKGVFTGWGITPDEVTYQPGESIKMPYTDQTLYAIFQKGVKFSDSITGTESFTTEEGDVQVPELTAPDASYIFDGWYDANGDKLEGDTVTVSADSAATYKAFWKSVLVSDIKTRYYKDLTVPAGEQVKVSFSVKNQGNEGLTGLKISLEGEGVKNLTGDLSTRFIAPGQTKTGTWTVIISGDSGAIVDATLTVTNEDGDTWTVPVQFTVK